VFISRRGSPCKNVVHEGLLFLLLLLSNVAHWCKPPMASLVSYTVTLGQSLMLFLQLEPSGYCYLRYCHLLASAPNVLPGHKFVKSSSVHFRFSSVHTSSLEQVRCKPELLDKTLHSNYLCLVCVHSTYHSHVKVQAEHGANAVQVSVTVVVLSGRLYPLAITILWEHILNLPFTCF